MESVGLADVVLMALVGLVGWLSPTIMEMKRNIRDLHKWHAPDDQGRQNWKVPDLAKLVTRIDNLISILERNHKVKG